MRSPLLYEQRSSVGSCCVSACLFLVTLNCQFFAKPIAETNAVFTCFTFLMKFKYVYIIYIIYTYTCFLILSS